MALRRAAATALRGSSGVGAVRAASTFTLPPLPYDYSALEPAISGEIMELHHTKHHQAYVNGLNAALQAHDDAKTAGDVQALVAAEGALRFNGGGHANHTLFWSNLAPKKEGGGEPPSGALAEALNDQFGSLNNTITRMSAAAVAVQGSGWAWLGFDKTSERLAIRTTPNQDPAVLVGLIPLLGIDVWEHAYYLQYKNVRPDYVKAIWSVVNWQTAEDRYKAAISK
eukprot:jgi/Chlat1/2270/Chrsp17S08728